MAEIARLDGHGWEAYRDVRLSALEDAPTAFGSTLEVERARAEAEWRARLEHRTQFVAREGARTVATVGCLDEDGAVELVSMWVAPEARGSGVADRLVGAVLDVARARGHGITVLWVSDGNRAAERLYERHGFARTGRVQPIDDDDPARGMEFEMRREEH
jgi:GNAT superfamily N-acetyltransferase